MEILASRILLEARDLDASIGFYEEVVGLRRFREFGRPPHRGVVYFLGGGYLELTEASTDEAVKPPGRVRVWLQVPDLADAARVLRDAGVTLAETPRLQPWGLLEAVVHDPDGLALVLVEVPSDHPMRRDTR